MKYRAEIDGLRTLAVIPVILFHAEINLFSGGFIGVDIFFVISGYLITTILINDISNNNFNLINFYERRARRILPALFFVMLVCIPFALIFMLPSLMVEFSKSLIAVPLFISNILFWKNSGYFDAAFDEVPLLHTWSLAVEEQYYLLFPLFLLLTWRFGKKNVLILVTMLALFSLVLSELSSQNMPGANFYLLPTRIWELLVGSIAALILIKREVKSNNFYSIIGLSLILFSIFNYDKNTPFPSIYTLVPVLGTALLIIYANKKTLVAKILSTKMFVGIGVISYSAYLWHQPVFVFFSFGLEKDSNNFIKILLLTFIFILAFFSWKYIEQPFRKKSKLLSKQFFLIFGIISIFIITVGTFGIFSNGFSAYTLNQSENKLVKSLKRSVEKNCKKSINECIKISSENKSVLLLGDSNAYHFSTSLKNVSEQRDLNYIQLTKGGCLPLSNFYRLDTSDHFNEICNVFNNKIITEFSDLNHKVDIIVVSAAWLEYLDGNKNLLLQFSEQSIKKNEVKLSENGHDEIPNDKKIKLFEKYLFEILSLLSDKSNFLIVVGPLPPTIVNFKKKSNVLNPDNLPYSFYDKYSENFKNIINKLNKQISFKYIDLSNYICDVEYCYTTKNGRYIYGDGSHLSKHGQNQIMKPLFEQLIKIN